MNDYLNNKWNKGELKLFPYEESFPKLHEEVFLAPGVKIIGDVEIGKDSSIWYNSVIRGDVNYIKIGNLTNIQDCSMLHVTNNKYALNIGDQVTIGHSVTLHGCTIDNRTLIGMKSVILDGAVIKPKSIVGAGAVVKEKFIVPEGTLVAGVPARVIRELTQSEIDDIEESSHRYKSYTKKTISSLIKNNYQI